MKDFVYFLYLKIVYYFIFDKIQEEKDINMYVLYGVFKIFKFFFLKRIFLRD